MWPLESQCTFCIHIFPYFTFKLKDSLHKESLGILSVSYFWVFTITLQFYNYVFFTITHLTTTPIKKCKIFVTHKLFYAIFYLTPYLRKTWHWFLWSSFIEMYWHITFWKVKVYSVMVDTCIYYKMITTIRLYNTTVMSHNYLSFLVRWFKIYSLSNFELDNTGVWLI